MDSTSSKTTPRNNSAPDLNLSQRNQDCSHYSIVEGIEARELIRRQGLSDDVDGVFGSFGKNLELPINSDDLPIDRGWDCERMVVRGVVGQDMGHSNVTSGPSTQQGQAVNTSRKTYDTHAKKTDHVEVEAVLVSALETMGRYRVKIKKDLYRAIETLRAVKAKSG
jgi:hypothetical protein